MRSVSPIRQIAGDNSHEEQFYKMKSRRLQTENDSLKTENVILYSKLKDYSAVQRSVKEENQHLQQELKRSFNSNSYPYAGRHREYNSLNASSFSPYRIMQVQNSQNAQYLNRENERLLKEMRVLKNSHQLQIATLNQQVRRLTRLNSELQTLNAKSKDIKNGLSDKKSSEQKLSQIKQQMASLKRTNERIEKQNHIAAQTIQARETQIARLKYQLEQLDKQFQQQKRRNQWEEQNNLVITDNESIRKMLLSQYQPNNTERTNRSRRTNAFEQLKQELNNKTYEIQTLNSNICTLKQQFENTLRLEVDKATAKWTTENRYLEQKIRILHQELQAKDQELKQLLIKLKPLIKNRPPSQNYINVDSRRPSLSLLEVMLDKYKINTFGTKID